MRKYVIMVIVALSMAIGSQAAQAENRDYRWGVDSNRYSPYHPNNRYYPGPYYNHNHQYRRNNDKETAYLVGGILLTAVIASAISNNNSNNNSNNSANTVTLPPPPKRKIQICQDVVAYDEAQKPYVLRQCTITEQ
jgi:hypothetical protein